MFHCKLGNKFTSKTGVGPILLAIKDPFLALTNSKFNGEHFSTDI